VISFLYRPRRRKGGKLGESRFYSAKIRMEWERGSPAVVALKVADRREAERLLAEEVKRRYLEHGGMLPPREEQQAAERPLNELLTAFLDDMRVIGRAATTVKKYGMLRHLLTACDWRKMGEVTAKSFCAWRAKSGLAPKTLNDTLKNFGVFWHWLRKQRMARENPLEFVELVETRRREKYRRALTEDELRRLLSVAKHYRAVVYLLIAKTGLRREEVERLTVGDFELDTPSPFVRVRASISKHPKEVCQRLTPEVVAAVRSILPDHPLPFELVFSRRVPNVRTLKKDLARACIPFQDAQGRRVDLHALRDTFGTQLAAAGVAPFVLKELMRHSTVQQSEKYYIDATHLPLAAAMAKLPSYTLPEEDAPNDTQKDTQKLRAGGL
jgi:integrase